MKKEKGEAAFDSPDDVLTDRIINQSGKHGAEKDSADADSGSDYAFDPEIKENDTSRKKPGKGLIIAAVAGIVLLIAGIFMVRGRKRNCDCQNS